MKRILIADDHQMFIDGIRSLLKSDKDLMIAGEANNGQEVIDFVSTQKADVVLLDMNMPLVDGMHTLKWLKANYPEVKVIMLTMYNTLDYIEKLLKAGADGYILKNTGKEELKKGIDVVLKGEPFFSDEVTTRIMKGLQGKNRKNHDDMPVELTDRETDVIKLIAREFTTAEIAEKLFISTNTVETHRKNLFSKLGVRNVAGLVKYALLNGMLEE